MDDLNSSESFMTVSYYLVAFIDLLGQKNDLKKLPRAFSFSDPTKRDELVQYIKKTFGTVQHFYEAFDDYFKANSDYQYSRLPPPVAERLKQSRVKYQTFTDGITIFTSLQETGESIPVQDVFAILSACASVFVMFLSIGKPLRGGVDIGIGMETARHGIYGPVVVQAYELESSMAEYPRIAVGNGVVEYLQSEANFPGSDLFSAYRKSLSQTCMNILCLDTDGTRIIDYLGKGFKDSVANDILGDLPLKAYEFVTTEAERFKIEKDGKLLNRYTRLKQYFDRELDRWIRS